MTCTLSLNNGDSFQAELRGKNKWDSLCFGKFLNQFLCMETFDTAFRFP